MNVTLTDVHVEILLGIAASMKLPEGLNETERVEIGLDALIEAYDSQQEVTDGIAEVGTPVDAATLRDAMQRVTNPNLSTEFVQPEVDIEADTPKKTLEELIAMDPTNSTLNVVAASEDQEMMDTAVIVYNAIPQSDWKDTARMSALCQSVYRKLVERKEATKNTI